jgi:hypothetical protein
MNRKKALFCYEMKNMVWFLLLGLLGAVAAAFTLRMSMAYIFQKMHGIGIYSYSSSGYMVQGSPFAANLVGVLRGIVVACLFGFALMSFMQFSDLQSRKKREYLSSLPFSQNEKFCMKVIVSYGMITLCWLVLSVLVIGIRLKYQPQIIKNNVLSLSFRQFMGADTMWHTIRSLLLCWLTLLAMYSIYMAVHYLVRSSLVASLIGACAMYYPVFVISVVPINFLAYSGNTEKRIMSVLYRAQRYTRMFFGSGLGYVYGNNGFEYRYEPLGADKMLVGDGSFYTVSYGKVWLSVLILVVLMVGCTLLAWWVNKHQDLAKINRMVPTKAGRIGLSFGISTAIGSVAISMFSISEMTVAIGIWLLVSVIVYFICQKILKK